ncbi:hypothetical protein BDZ94DRAFT_1323853 [Collybia nuda]|uniref:Uncharacterized protein n=1 Tax=Collybia nuda TaxID=64659 RepID=A0A9P6CFZ9_9AGAR|nr:hypothetical protein BDZ94DRAFT_1323853 [Collybia nuda]
MVCEVRDLGRFVSKLSEVQQVSLRLMHPLIPEWESAVLGLLDTILLKSCTSLSVKNLESSTYAGSKPSLQLPPLTWPASMVFAAYRYFFEKPRRAPHLTTCNIQALPRFLLPFYEHALNASSITSLSFKHIFNAQKWAVFSERLYLPKLEHLSITHCAILAQPLETFFLRHSSISSLDLRHNSLMPLHPTRLAKGILPRLAKLQTSPDYITRYFPVTGTFPMMASISTTIGHKTHHFDRVNDLLGCIRTCRSDLTLTLTFGYSAGLETWLRGEEPQMRVEPTLHCVKALELDSWPNQGGFKESTLILIARWLALFPAVERISIHRRCFLDSTELNNLFFQHLKRALVPRIFDYNTTQAGLYISESRSI